METETRAWVKLFQTINYIWKKSVKELNYSCNLKKGVGYELNTGNYSAR